MDLSKLIYYVNQGNPAAVPMIAYAAYQGYMLLKRLIDAIDKQNMLIVTQTETMKAFVERMDKVTDARGKAKTSR